MSQSQSDLILAPFIPDTIQPDFGADVAGRMRVAFRNPLSGFLESARPLTRRARFRRLVGIMELNGAVCVITGAARGIGYALAEKLCGRGARVALTDQDAEALQAASQRLAESDSHVEADAVTLPADVRDREALRNVVESVQHRWGKIDVWINNAGLARHRAIPDFTEEEMDLMMDVNLKGTVLGCQEALRVMAPHESGHIVNMISTAGLRGIPMESFYCATKWAVRGFTQALQEEAAPYGIRVTAVLPGGVDTAFWEDATDAEMPVGSFLKPAQVAEAVCQVLAQDDACVTRELVVRSIEDRDFAGH